MRSRKFAGAVAMASAVGLLAVATVATAVIRRGRPAEPSAAAAVSSAATPSALAAPLERAQQGQQARYTFELFADTVQKASGRVQQRVQGALAITRLDADAHRERWEITALEISGSKNGQALETQHAQPGVACVVQRSSSGVPLELTFAPGAPAEQRQRLEQLVSVSQAGTAPASTETWTEREADATGSYLADYARRADGGLHRSKRVYDSEGARAVALRITQSEATLRFEAGRIVSVHEQQRIDLQQGALSVDSKGIIERVQAPAPVSLDASALLATGQQYPFGRASQISENERDLAAVRGLTLPDGIASLAAAPSDQARSQSARRLGSLFRLQPELANAALPAVDGLNEPATLALISSLAEARSEAAARALSTLANASNRSRAVRLSALEGLSRNGLPASFVVPALQSALADPLLQSTAALNLGIVAFETRTRDPDLALAARQPLLARYREGGEQSSLFIAALGNAGAPELLASIRDVAKQSDPNLRGELVWAARKLTDDSVERTIAWALSKEKSPLVRRRALQVCARWPRERACPALEVVALHDVDAVTRQEGLRALWSRSRSDADRADVLRVAKLATRDPDPKTRQLAETLVSQLQRSGSTGEPMGLFFGAGSQ